MSDLILQVTEQNGDLVVDSRLIAVRLNIEHESFMCTIKKYEKKIEQRFGVIRWQIGVPCRPTGGRPPLFALLTEDQVKAFLANSRRGLTLQAVNEFKELGFDFSLFAKSSEKRRKSKESDYSNDLAQKLNGCREVKTLAGNIDVLTSSEIIEVKNVSSWKSALGQVLVYGDYYPSHTKRIHLYGETQESFLNMIRSHCKKLKVVMTWEA